MMMVSEKLNQRPSSGRGRLFVALMVGLALALALSMAFADDAQAKKKKKKVTLCHEAGQETQRTIKVSKKAAKQHLAHGDTPGACAPPPSEEPTPEEPAPETNYPTKPLPTRVIGGTEVPDGKYPFVAALLDKRVAGTGFDKQFCGGTLIDSDSILTAAHCVDSIYSNNVQVAVGRTVLSDGTQGQVRDVSRIYIPDGYNYKTYERDVAVLKLTSPVTGITPVQLSSSTLAREPGYKLTVAGWGNTIAQPPSGGAGTNYPDRMREAEVPVVSDADAAKVYSDYVSASMIAAGATGKDTCQGDSGGPLFYGGVSLPKYGIYGYYQVGITSTGAGCGAAGYPTVYTDVNEPFIKDFITTKAAQ